MMSVYVETLTKVKGNWLLFWKLFKRDMWMRYAWLQWILPFEIANLIFGLATWVYYGKAFGGNSPLLRPYGGDFLAYIILGMSFNQLLMFSMSGIYYRIRNLHTGSWSSFGVRMSLAEYIAVARIPMFIYLSSSIFWGYCQSFIKMIIYIGAGVFLFKMQLIRPEANYIGTVFFILLGISATIGLGLISASMVWFAGAWHGNEPIQWLVGMMVSIASGVYFPPEVLPDWLSRAAQLLPQTHSLRAARLAILQGYSIGQLRKEILFLLILTIVLLTAGILLFRYSQEIAKRRGALS
ncbi:MAG: ABC transporter permease [Candidatus Poribacteria bacterium]